MAGQARRQVEGAEHAQDVATGLDSSFNRMADSLDRLCKSSDAQVELLEEIRDNQEMILGAFDKASEQEVTSLGQFFAVWGEVLDEIEDEDEEPEVIQVEAERI